jgi:hypothetical protein
VKDFGINICTFVWDRFLFEGEIAIYRSCLAAFWCLREHLLSEGLQGVSTILQDPSKFVTTSNFQAAHSKFLNVDYHVLSQALHQVNVNPRTRTLWLLLNSSCCLSFSSTGIRLSS